MKEDPLSTLFAQDMMTIFERVRRYFPMPFSGFASELLYELSAPNPDWTRIFLIQIDCFEGCVSFFSFILLAEIERHPEIEVKSSANLIQTLYKGGKLSTGHWWALLRDLSKDVQEHKELNLSDAARITLNLFYPNKQELPAKLHRFKDLLNEVPTIRNRVKGHSFTLPPEQYASHATELLKTSSMFFSVINEIDNCTIFYVSQCVATADDIFQVDILLLNGDMRRPLRKNLHSDQSFSIGSLWICLEADLSQNISIGKCRLMSPFVQYNPTNNLLYISQQIQKKKVELIGIIGGERIISENSDFGLRRLSSVLERSQSSNNDYEKLLLRMRELGQVVLDSPAAIASYDEQSYLSRPRLSQQLDSVGHQGNDTGLIRIWLASAPSGSGKTAMACHAVSIWLNGGSQHGEMTVVALSSEILASQGSITCWWEQKFGESIIKSSQTASGENALIRLFIDGLDRLTNPNIIVEDLVTIFADPMAQKGLRVILTATEAVSNQIFDLMIRKGLQESINRWSIPPLSLSEARSLFIRLHPSASDQQLGPEIETLLTSPLLVRLVQVLGESETTVNITPGRLLRAHADRTVLVDPVRSHLALKIVSHVLTLERKSIPLETLLEDTSLRSVLLTSGAQAPLQQLIQEHVLLLDRAPSSNGLPLPSKTMVSFAFDAQLDYLAFAHLASQYGTHPLVWSKGLKGRKPFGPLIGGLRVFVVESLLDNPELSTLHDLATLLFDLEITGSEVLKDLLTIGLDVTQEGSLSLFLQKYLTLSNPSNFAQIAEESLHRMIIAGRAQSSYELMTLLWTISPTKDFVPLCRYIIHITVWAVGIEPAFTLVRALHQATFDMDQDIQILVLDTLREVHTLSGLASDFEALKKIEQQLLQFHNDGLCERIDAKVALELVKARWYNYSNLPPIEAGLQRDFHLNSAINMAEGHNELMMQVRSERALLYADKELNLASREIRQQACQDAVEFACSIGDPFAEALSCDVTAMAWHTNLGIQMDWIERGLIGASALHAQIARARLLDRRGRIYLSQGRLDEALEDASEASRIFEEVGHQRHVLRTKQHLYALAMHETGNPGLALQGWEELIPLADTLGVHFQSRLIRLLKSSLLVNLGRIAEAETLIEEVSSMCVQKNLSKDVNIDLFKGRLEKGKGNQTQALIYWKNAQDWAYKIRFSDVFFQSFLHIQWTKVLLYGRDVGGDFSQFRQGIIQKIRGQLEEKVFEHHQARFAGELRLLLALTLLLEDWMEEANSRLEDAKNWFHHHQQHPLYVEQMIVELIFQQKELLQKIEVTQDEKQKQNLQVHFQGYTTKKIEQCRAKVRDFADTFSEEIAQRQYCENHRLEKLIQTFIYTTL